MKRLILFFCSVLACDDEVKSTWTIEKMKDNVFLKQQAAKEFGYNYEIWIYDKNGIKTNCYQ